MEDADKVKLTELCEVVHNGSDAVGTILEWTTLNFRRTSRQLISSSAKARATSKPSLARENKRTSSFNPNVMWSLKI